MKALAHDAFPLGSIVLLRGGYPEPEVRVNELSVLDLTKCIYASN